MVLIVALGKISHITIPHTYQTRTHAHQFFVILVTFPQICRVSHEGGSEESHGGTQAHTFLRKASGDLVCSA